MKTAILVDGGFYRRRAYTAYGDVTPELRAKELYDYCLRHLTDHKTKSDLYRIFYYDCPATAKRILGLWEQLNNPNFKLVEFDQFKNNAGSNGFVLPPQQWIAKTNAIGIISKSGRYGGTYAHTDIAFEFASWISPEFKLYIIKDYQRLKNNENVKNQLEWNAKRELSKANYKIHTDAVKEYLIADLPKDYASRVYANEADLLNMALFGMTAKEWRTANPDRKKENIRDDASALQLTVLFNLETLNAHFIQQGFPSAERVKLLHDIAESQLKRLEGNASIKRLENVIKKK